MSSQSRKSDMTDIGTFTKPKNKMVPLSPWDHDLLSSIEHGGTRTFL